MKTSPHHQVALDSSAPRVQPHRLPGSYRLHLWALVLTCSGLSGCASGTLGAGMLGSMMATASLDAQQPARIAQARAEQSAQADVQARPEPTVPVNTQNTYLSVVRQIQQKSLWHASLAHLDALEKQWGTTPESVLLRADALRHTGETTTSAHLYESLRGTAHAASALHGLGLIEAHAQRYAKAVLHMEQARKLNPLQFHVLSDLGYAYLHLGRHEDAQRLLLQASELAPDQPRIFMNLAVLWLSSGRNALAESVMARYRFNEATRSAIHQQALALKHLPALSRSAPVHHEMQSKPHEDRANTEQVLPTQPHLALQPSDTSDGKTLVLANGMALSLQLAKAPTQPPWIGDVSSATALATSQR